MKYARGANQMMGAHCMKRCIVSRGRQKIPHVDYGTCRFAEGTKLVFSNWKQNIGKIIILEIPSALPGATAWCFGRLYLGQK